MHRIFANAPARRALPRPERPQPPVEIEHVKPSIDDAAIIAILASPAIFGETIEATYRRKEHELAALFSLLARVDALALHRRLSNEDDALAKRFGGLVVERRERLLGVLMRSR